MLKKGNYFGMYLRQKVLMDMSEIATLKGVHNVVNWCNDGVEKSFVEIVFDTHTQITKFSSRCKLILRTFEDMTGEEVKKLYKIRNGINVEGDIINFSVIGRIKIEIRCKYIYENKKYSNRLTFYIDKLSGKEFDYLISIGIDCFGLIEKGWAVRESEAVL